MEEYRQYYHIPVRIIVDARIHNSEDWNFESNVSLKIDCVPVSETDKLLNLEEVCVLNSNPTEKFRKGSINKDYIIGVLERQIED